MAHHFVRSTSASASCTVLLHAGLSWTRGNRDAFRATARPLGGLDFPCLWRASESWVFFTGPSALLLTACFVFHLWQIAYSRLGTEGERHLLGSELHCPPAATPKISIKQLSGSAVSDQDLFFGRFTIGKNSITGRFSGAWPSSERPVTSFGFTLSSFSRFFPDGYSTLRFFFP